MVGERKEKEWDFIYSFGKEGEADKRADKMTKTVKRRDREYMQYEKRKGQKEKEKNGETAMQWVWGKPI